MDLYTPFISWAPPPLQPPGTEAGNIGHYMPHAEQQPTHPGRRVAPSMRQLTPSRAYKIVVVTARKNLLAVEKARQCLRAHGY